MASPNVYERSDLTADVLRAVIRLQELGGQMKDDSFNFTPKELQNLDDLMYYLKELDSKRQTTHESLETETIKNSIVRRKLENHPQKLANEIQDKVRRAQELNADQISSLQLHAAETADRIAQSKSNQEALKLHSELLETEHEKLLAKYSEFVRKLNEDCMSEKTSVQIDLNEAREKFKATLDKVNSIKREIREVEEGMEIVMKKFTGEMHSLNNMVGGVRSEQKRMREHNLNLEKILKEKKDGVGDKEIVIEKKLVKLTRLESNIQSLMQTEATMKEQNGQLQKEIELLKNECATLVSNAKQVREEYHHKEKVVQDKRNHMKKQLELISGEMSDLVTVSKKLKKELKILSDDAEMQEAVIRDLKDKVGESKKNLLSHSEQGAKLAKEYEMMGQNLNELKISHQEAMQIYHNEISTLKARLEEDTKTKEIVHSSYEDLTATVQTKTTTHKDVMASLQTRLTDGRRMSTDLTIKIDELELSTKQGAEEVAVSEEKLKQTKTKLKKRKKSLTTAVEVLEETVCDLKEEVGDRNETLSRITPQCIAIEKNHAEKSENYDGKKKELIELKSEKSQVQDRIKEVNQNMEKMHLPQQKLQMDTLRCRAYTRQRVSQYTREVDTLEKQVTEATQKLTAVDKENKRIVETSQVLSKEIARMQRMLSCSKDMEDQLDAALQLYRDKLTTQWSKNKELEEASAARDSLVLQNITKLREASENRHHVISSLHEQFETELKGFSDYIAVTAQRPPS